MESEVKEFILNHRLIEPGDRIVAGVSGGADSVAMLLVLHALAGELEFTLFACHLNHQLRGEASDGDEAYVRQLAEKLNVPCYVGRKDVNAIRRDAGGSLEEVARRVRYEFFEEAVEHFHAGKAALAHHRDDQCETIVFNLIRGAGIHGLRGIPVRRRIRPDGGEVLIIRPMLGVSKQQIEDYLRGRSIDWRRDHSNELLVASRNIIRHKLLPAMEEINGQVRERLGELARQAGEVELLLAERVRGVLATARKEHGEIRIQQWRIASLPEVVAGEVVRAMLMELGAGLGPFTSRHFRVVATLKTRLELPGGWWARVEHGQLIIGPKHTNEKNKREQPLAIGGLCHFGTFAISAALRDFDAGDFNAFLESRTHFQEWIDADTVAGELHVRHAREGERFHPLGSRGSKKVGDFLTDVKAGWSARPAVVVADEKGIVWLVGWRIDERVKLTKGTKRALTLSASPGIISLK